MRLGRLGVTQEANTLVGDDVGEVVEVVDVVVFDPLTVVVHAVVVEPTVADQPVPFRPPGRHVRPRILVQVFTEVACNRNNYSPSSVCGRSKCQSAVIPPAINENLSPNRCASATTHPLTLPLCHIDFTCFFILPTPSKARRYCWCGLSANLECMCEMCCTWLAENTGRKNRHFSTIAQICRAVSSQLARIDNRKKTC